jgi:hypothetical protein
MRTLQDYVATYGPEAGPKIYRTIKSRAAYKGVSTRRRHRIEALTGRPYRTRRRPAPASGVCQALLPLAGPVAAAEAGERAIG